MESYEALRASLSKVLSHIKRYREETNKYIQDSYVEFLPHDASSDMYMEEGENLITETREVLKNIESESNSDKIELDPFGKELKDAIVHLQITLRILQIDNLFQCAEEANATNDYLLVLELLNKVKKLIHTENNSDNVLLQRARCYENLKIKYHIQSHILQQNLRRKFEGLIQFKEKQLPNSQYITILISNNESQLHDIAMALFQTNYNPEGFCNFLLKKCFEPIIKKNAVIEFNEESNEHIQIKVSYTSKELSHRSKTFYIQVLNSIRLILNSLNKMNVSISEKEHVFTVIGDKLNDKLFPLLINECLLLCVPESKDEAEASNLVDDITQFEQFLADIFLIDTDKHTYLSKFCEKYERLYKNRCYKKVVDTAKKIIQKDLQEIILTAEGNSEEEVKNNPMLFPKCMVSKNILEFAKLMELAIRQNSEINSTEDNSYTSLIPLLINIYVIQVPKVHIEFLESFPQQAAIFHNNCIFLSHWVVKHYESTKSLFPTIINVLQSTGKKYLDMQIAAQQTILMNILKDFVINGKPNQKHPIKVIKNCFNKLDLLKNVWQNVLPETIYNQTFIYILHDIFHYIINRIMSVDNLSLNIVSEVVHILDIVAEKSSTLFKDPKKLSHMTNWIKLQTLITILNGSPQEIAELWCENMMVQSLFKPDEVRSIIRAMFPNTDTRAKALSKLL